MTGLSMAPWPLTVAIAAPVAGRIADRLSTAWLCAAGGACLALGLAAIALWPLVPLTMLCGLGPGFFRVPTTGICCSRPRASGAVPQAGCRAPRD
jgi:DHA2 family multidrug resistance protein-like MFS transporter